MSWEKQTENLAYINALKATENIEVPSQGFAAPAQSKTAFDFQRVLIKQNNTLLSLIIELHTQLQELQNQVRTLKQVSSATTAAPKELEGAIDDLTKRISGLNLGSEAIIPKKRGSILIFRNPSDILQKENDK